MIRTLFEEERSAGRAPLFHSPQLGFLRFPYLVETQLQRDAYSSFLVELLP